MKRMPNQLIIRHIGQLLTMDGSPEFHSAFRMIADAAMVIVDGMVDWIGPDDQLNRSHDGLEIDVQGALVSPGLVDAHTHLIYAGDRAYEVRMRSQGRTYMEILEAGGGILATVKATRQATDEDLLKATRRRLSRALAQGTTVIEVKSGYDLTADGEIRLLELIGRLSREGPWRIIPTALAAHAVPPEFAGRPSAYLDYLIQHYLPRVASFAQVVDIFTEPGVFSIEESKTYLQAAKGLGLRVKLHIDELAGGQGGFLAADLQADSADHCAVTPEEAFAAMARSGVVAVLLPGTARYLDHGHLPNARAMLDQGGWIAIASDGNPGSSPTDSLSSLMPWAASWLKLTPEQVWTAVTRGGARALRQDYAGGLHPGWPADFVVWDAEHYEFPCYYYGVNLVREVYVSGQRVAINQQSVL